MLSRRQAIIWTNADPVHRRIYAAPGGDGLTSAHATIQYNQFENYTFKLLPHDPWAHELITHCRLNKMSDISMSHFQIKLHFDLDSPLEVCF